MKLFGWLKTRNLGAGEARDDNRERVSVEERLDDIEARLAVLEAQASTPQRPR